VPHDSIETLLITPIDDDCPDQDIRKKIGRGEIQQGLSKWSSITYEEQLEVIEPKSDKERVGQIP